MRTAFKYILCAALLAGAGPTFAADLRHDVDAWRASHEAEIVGRLAELVKIRSVAAHPDETAAAGAKLESWLKERGFRTALFRAKDSPPLVFGALGDDPAKRTVVFYAHYDGQPVTPSQWSTDPFVPTMMSGPLGPQAKPVDWQAAKPPYDPEWRLFGRAAADDKASEIAFLAAFDALKASGIPPSVNIRVAWEGEEEASSAHLAQILKEHAQELKSDLWLIGDGPIHQSRRPTLIFGARGVVDLQMTVYGPVRALHDGHYGNWVQNPAFMAAELVSQMRDGDGKILIPGFGDDVRPLSNAEKAAIAKLPPIEDQLKREFQIARSEGDEGLTASTMRPALNVRGLRSGQVGADTANAIPVDAAVSIDFRLVPDETPSGVRAKVENFLRAKGWTIVSDTPDEATRLAHPKIVRLAWDEGYAGLRADMSSPVARAIIAAADSAAGEPVALLPMLGGSVPLYMFDAQFHVPTIILPIVNHDDNQHAANENLRLRNLWDGIDTYAAMMSRLNW